MDSNIKQDTRIDESWEAYRFFQDVKNTIERVFDECDDTYPMILFPSQLSKVLKDFVEDNYFSRVSNIMELIIKHGSKAQDYERDWNLYKRKPFKPHLVYPEKKKATKKAIDPYYPTEMKDVYKPSGCLIIWGITMGFSFNEIDMPYIEKMWSVNCHKEETDWSVYWHSDGEEEFMKKELFKLGANKSSITTIKW